MTLAAACSGFVLAPLSTVGLALVIALVFRPPSAFFSATVLALALAAIVILAIPQLRRRGEGLLAGAAVGVLALACWTLVQFLTRSA